MMATLNILTLWVFAVSFGPAAGQPVPPGPATKATVTVDARYPWVDSGLVVHKGQRLAFAATGTIQWGLKPDQVAGPDGRDAKPGKIGVGGLIGRVGYSGKPFPIGTRTPIAMPKDGKLFLGINDFIFKDNAGSFTVTITEPKAGADRERQGSMAPGSDTNVLRRLEGDRCVSLVLAFDPRQLATRSPA